MNEKRIQIHRSFKDADEAEDRYYANLTQAQRMDIFLELLATTHGWHTDEASERLERVCRITTFEQS